MMGVHFAISSRTKRSNWAGVLPTGVAPSCSARSRIAGVDIAFAISPLSCSTIACGVAAAASRPNQPTTS